MIDCELLRGDGHDVVVNLAVRSFRQTVRGVG